MTNKVTQQQIDALLDNATTEEHLFHGGKSLIISYQLENGFTIEGRAAIVDLAGFDIGTGRKVARANAASQLWALEGYLLQNKLYREQGVKAVKDKLKKLRDIEPYKKYFTTFEYKGERRVTFWEEEDGLLLVEVTFKSGVKQKVNIGELDEFMKANISDLVEV